MAENKTTTNAEKRRSLMEQLMLNYYNNQLYERGTITEQEHRQMRNKIRQRAKAHGVEL